LFYTGLCSRDSSDKLLRCFRFASSRKLSIWLFDRNSLSKFLTCLVSSDIDVIRLRLRFNSVSDDRPLRFSILEIWLFAILSTLKSFKCPKFSILVIRFECKSSTSSLVLVFKLRIFSILFFPNINTLNVLTVCRDAISLMSLSYRSRKIRLGSETRFSIFSMRLCC